MKTKKKGSSIFAVLVVIILFLVVACTVAANVIFSENKTNVQLGNYYLYMHEVENMAPDIPQNTLVIAESAPSVSLTPGNKVLCYLSDGTLALRVIYQITVNEDGSTSYYPGTAVEQGSELTIPRENIFAICTWQSPELYRYINFATSVSGIMLLLVVPCIILIIMFLVKIVRSSSDDMDDEEFMFNEEEEETKKKKRMDNPLFEPGVVPTADDSLERKKSSILENFEKKPVNENSPYQKAVQERTMKFRIQQQNIEEAKRQEAALQQGAPSGTQVFSKQTVEEAAKQQEAPTAETPAETPVRSATETTPAKTMDEPRASGPNIDDVIRPSELRAARSGQKINPDIAATDSIDDLLRVLEAEKKKLL